MQNSNWKRDAGIFIGSQAVSVFGSSLVSLAITWYITLQTNSGVFMTISVLCNVLPMLFMSPFAGVWADRYDRKRLIMLADGGIALVTLLLAALFLLDLPPAWQLTALLVMSVFRSLGGAVQNPAISAMLPDIVPAEHLTRVNGINGSIQSLITLLSPALAALLLNTLGSLSAIFLIDAVTAAAAILILLKFLRVQRRAPGITGPVGYGSEIRAGIAYIRRNKYLMHMFLICVIIYIAVAPVSFLTQLQVIRSYGPEVWRLSAIEIAFSAGMLLGGVFISLWGGFRNRVNTIGLSMALMGAFTMLMGAGVPFWLYIALMGLTGLMMPLFNTPTVTLLQERIDPAYIGRVFSVLSMISGSMLPLGMVIFGPLGDVVSIEALLLVSGALILLSAGLLMVDPPIRKVGVPAPEPKDILAS